MKKATVIPSYGSIYAVTGGKFLGEFFVFIEKVEDGYNFLSLPEMNVRSVPTEKFSNGVSGNVLQFQEILPKNVIEVCKAQYEKQKPGKKSYNRR